MISKNWITKAVVFGILLCLLGASTTICTSTNIEKSDKTPSCLLDDSLMGYWSFDDATDIGHDDSGNGNQGMNHGATWVSSGVEGGALIFDGSSNYVSFSSPVISEPPYSICAWIKPDSLTGSNNYVIANGGETGLTNGFYMNIEWQEQYNGDYSFGVGTESIFKGHSTYHPATTNWTFLCGTWDGVPDPSHIKLYVNGMFVGTSVSSTPEAGPVVDLHIGVSTANKGFFNGLIDEVRVYNKVLNEDEISDLNNILEVNVTGLLGVNLNIKNIGPSNAVDVDWQIEVKGGLFGRINVTKSGTIATLAPGDSIKVGTGMFLGIGKIQVTMKVDEDISIANATQLIILTRF